MMVGPGRPERIVTIRAGRTARLVIVRTGGTHGTEIVRAGGEARRDGEAGKEYRVRAGLRAGMVIKRAEERARLVIKRAGRSSNGDAPPSIDHLSKRRRVKQE